MNTDNEIMIYQYAWRTMQIGEIKEMVDKAKFAGATHVKFNINYAPAGSRDEGPSTMMFIKELSAEEMKKKKIAWHQEQIKALEQE